LTLKSILDGLFKRAVTIIMALSLLAIALILLDGFSGFQGFQFEWSDMWHHRATLLALAENPFSPANPHVATHDLSRSYIPIYVLVGLLAHFMHFPPDTSLLLVSLADIGLLLLGCSLFSRALGVRGALPLFVVLLFAWGYPPNFPGFHDLRSLGQTNAIPAAHAFALTFITWGLLIDTFKVGGARLGRWLLITLLVTLVILSHQFTAVLCIGGMVIFCLLPAGFTPMRLVATILAIVAAFLVSLAWPYFDLMTILASGTDKGWAPPHWFYDPVEVLKMCFPALCALIFLAQARSSRTIQIFGVCALVIFLGYIGSRLIGVEAGHRLLAYWILFLQLILFAVVFKADGVPETRWATAARPIFLLAMMVLGAGQIVLTGLDIFKLPLERAGYTFFFDSPRDYHGIGERIARDLPDDAIVVAHEDTAYPIQGFGVHVVSIPRVAPMIPDLKARQAATTAFFQPGLSCQQRLDTVAPFHATYAAFTTTVLPKAVALAIEDLGPITSYDRTIVVVQLPETCPAQ
jgi:hypothetical protein